MLVGVFAMTEAEAIIQIRSLRMQLDVLEAKLRASSLVEQHTFADLYGMLKDEVQTDAEEIDAVKYRGPSEE